MLDIVSSGDSLQDKSKHFIGKLGPINTDGSELENMKNVSLCSPVFLCTRHRAKLRRKVTLPMKNIYKKLIKSLFQKSSKLGHIICLFII